MTTTCQQPVVAPEPAMTLAPACPALQDNRMRQWLLCGLLVFVFLSAFFQVSDVDVGYHLRTAAYILQEGRIPAKNTFSGSVPEYPWMLQQWLGTIFFYLPFAWGGVKALITFKAVVAVLIVLLTWRRAVEQAGPQSWWPFWTATAAVVAMRVRFFERPDLISALFFASTLYCDGRWRNKRWWQWGVLPAWMALWANVHSGVIYGMVYLLTVCGAEWAAWLWNTRNKPALLETASPVGPKLSDLFIRPIGALLCVAMACLAVQVINPNGCRVLWVPISMFTSPFWQKMIMEFYPPTWSGAKTFFCFAAGLLLLQALTWRRVNLRSLFVSLVFGYLALSSQRSILFFMIAATAHAATMLEMVLPRTRLEAADPGEQEFVAYNPAWRLLNHRWIEPVLLVIVWVGIVLTVFIPNETFRFGTGWYRPYYPLEVYDFIKTQVPPQNTFNEMRYGGSMMWWLYPNCKPYVDGRCDAYSEEFWKTEYLPVLQARPGWQEILKKYRVSAALLPVYEDHTVPPLARTLHDDPDWALVAFNDNTLFFLRRTEANRDLIAQHEYRRIWPGEWNFAVLESPATRDEAARESKQALEFSPDSLFAQTAVARSYFVGEQYGPAVELLRHIVRQPGAGANYLRDFGYALFRLGQLKDADLVFARMIRENALPGFAWYMRHFIALAEKRDAEARNDLQQAIKLEPGNAEYRMALGETK